MLALEEQGNRVRIDRGWVSKKSAQGTILLTPVTARTWTLPAETLQEYARNLFVGTFGSIQHASLQSELAMMPLASVPHRVPMVSLSLSLSRSLSLSLSLSLYLSISTSLAITDLDAGYDHKDGQADLGQRLQYDEFVAYLPRTLYLAYTHTFTTCTHTRARAHARTHTTCLHTCLTTTAFV